MTIFHTGLSFGFLKKYTLNTGVGQERQLTNMDDENFFCVIKATRRDNLFTYNLLSVSLLIVKTIS